MNFYTEPRKEQYNLSSTKELVHFFCESVHASEDSDWFIAVLDNVLFQKISSYPHHGKFLVGTPPTTLEIPV